MNRFLDEDSPETIKLTPEIIATIVVNCLIILIVIYVVILYIKSKELHSYSSAYTLILSITILIDNILRLIPIDEDKNLPARYTQALFLTSLDKYILLALTLQVFIIYLGIMKTNFYYTYKKQIFFITFFSALGSCFLISGLFLIKGIAFYGIYNYASDSKQKQIFDTIFNSVFLVLNTFFCIVIMINICIRKEEIEKEVANENSERDLKRIIIIFIANTFIYVESFLIIYDKLPVPYNYIDLMYIITCLIINLVYTINKIVIKETKRIFCKKFTENDITKALPRKNTYLMREKQNTTNEDDYDD